MRSGGPEAEGGATRIEETLTFGRTEFPVLLDGNFCEEQIHRTYRAWAQNGNYTRRDYDILDLPT